MKSQARLFARSTRRERYFVESIMLTSAALYIFSHLEAAQSGYVARAAVGWAQRV